MEFEPDLVEIPLTWIPYSQSPSHFLIWDSKQFTIREKVVSNFGFQDRRPVVRFANIQSITWANRAAIAVRSTEGGGDEVLIHANSEYLKAFIDVVTSQNQNIAVDQANMELYQSPQQVENAGINAKYLIGALLLLALLLVFFEVASIFRQP